MLRIGKRVLFIGTGLDKLKGLILSSYISEHQIFK